MTQGTVRVPIGAVNSYPPLAAAWGRLVHALTTGTYYGLIIGVPLAVIAVRALKLFGHDVTTRDHKRGAKLISEVAGRPIRRREPLFDRGRQGVHGRAAGAPRRGGGGADFVGRL